MTLTSLSVLPEVISVGEMSFACLFSWQALCYFCLCAAALRCCGAMQLWVFLTLGSSEHHHPGTRTEFE